MRLLTVVLMMLCVSAANAQEIRTYANKLRRIENPQPLLADHPKFFEPIVEQAHFEAPAIVDEPEADLHVRTWRFSYNARGIIEMPNHLQARHTAVIMVHPWGIDDGQGWDTPEPAGVADFCTKEKNHLAAEHTRTIVKPLINQLRSRVGLTLYSLPGPCDAIRHNLYRSFTYTPTTAERAAAAKELDKVLRDFKYEGQPLPAELKLSGNTPVIDYFKQFPGLDASDRYNNAGFWKLPIPVTKDVDVADSDVVIYDAEGYAPLREFLKKHEIRHVLLTGYATDMCFCRTTAGYENLSKDFNVFLVGDASLATFPSNTSPRFAVNAAISFAALNQLVTQVSWIKFEQLKSP